MQSQAAAIAQPAAKPGSEAVIGCIIGLNGSGVKKRRITRRDIG
jgi:hypothetical protein